MTNKRFIEQFEENVQRYPDKVLLRDEHNSLTFRELDELSGRVYAYLKETGIGREDVVVVKLNRSVHPIVAMLGIWKAGAVAVVVEDSVSVDRMSCILADCRCKLLIDEECWLAITNTVPMANYTSTDVHDACQVVYTSGTEGKPKGVIIEYGKLDLNMRVQNYFWGACLMDNDISLVLGPISSMLSLTFIYFALTRGMCSDIAPINMVYDVEACTRYISQRKITVAGLPPSYLQSVLPKSWSLRFLIVGGELAQGLYKEDYIIHNVYGSTESAFGVCDFVIDRLYDNTPIGRNSPFVKVMLLEEGLEVAKGSAGELCHEVPYTRGYTNGDYSLLDGDGLYHTGDIARINEDGNYVILGRKSDMIKINGNRIEPAEIEAAVKKVLGIDWAFAKGFVEPEHSYIAVYYTADIQIDYARTREQLLKILPTYMIPSYFVRIDEVPHLPNGKVDRQALRAPEIEQYRAEYVAPKNDIEEQLCAQMERILGTSIGALDDFYLMGGDSLRTIELVTNLQLDGLTVTDIYAARTPRAIAARLQSRASGTPSSAPAPHQSDHFLLPYSQMVYELEQQMPGGYTFPFTLEYAPEQIDTERLNSAIKKAIAAHPVFDGNEQYYSIEAIEEKGEEARGYLKVRLNRILGDGYSFGILLEDICRAYHGLPIPEDHYIDYLAEYKNHTQTSEYAEHRDALVAHYVDCGSDACPVRPTLDKEIEEGDEWLAGEYILSLPNSVSEGGKGATQWRDRGYSMNERVCLATAMAIMDYCGTDAAALTWAYLGRENEQQMHIFGSLHKDIPLVVHRAKCKAQSELVQELKEEMQRGIIMSDYPYTLTQPYHDTWAYAVNILQQPRLEDINLHGLEFGTLQNAECREQSAYSLLDIEIEDNLLRFKYSATHYRESSIVRFAELIQKYLLC